MSDTTPGDDASTPDGAPMPDGAATPPADDSIAVGAQLQRAALDVIRATRVLLDAVEHAVQDPSLVTATFSNLVAVGKFAVQALASGVRDAPAREQEQTGDAGEPGPPAIEHIPLS